MRCCLNCLSRNRVLFHMHLHAWKQLSFCFVCFNHKCCHWKLVSSSLMSRSTKIAYVCGYSVLVLQRLELVQKCVLMWTILLQTRS